MSGLRLLDGDHAVVADLGERLADELADLGVLRGDRRDVGDLLLALHRRRRLVERGADRLDGSVDAALERAGAGAGGNVAQARLDQRLRQHGRRGGAVARDVVRLGGHGLGELRAEVLVGIIEFDLAGDRHAVIRDDGRAERLVDDDVSAPGTESDLDRVGQFVDATLERAARVLVKAEDLGH